MSGSIKYCSCFGISRTAYKQVSIADQTERSVVEYNWWVFTIVGWLWQHHKPMTFPQIISVEI